MSDTQTTAQASQQTPPAPAETAFEAFEDMVHRRLTAIEGFVAKAQPLLATVEGLAGAVVPGAQPVVTAVTELQSVVTDVIDSLDSHFGRGKIGLPAAPTSTVTPAP